MIYMGDIIQYLVMFFIIMIVSMLFAIFSPLGIFFILFSIIRAKAKDLTLRKVALVFQIILIVLTFIIGVLVSLLFVLRDSGFYIYSEGWIATLAVLCGAGFVIFIEVIIIVWETYRLKEKGAAVKLKGK